MAVLVGAPDPRYAVYVEGEGILFESDDVQAAQERFEEYQALVHSRGLALLDRDQKKVIRKFNLSTDILLGSDDAQPALGESQVSALVQFFNTLHRPPKWEAAVEALYAAYSAVKATNNVVAMSQIGQQAEALTEAIAKDVRTPAPPPATNWWDAISLPWWGKALAGGVAAYAVWSLIAPIAAPVVVGSYAWLKSRSSIKGQQARLAAHREGLIVSNPLRAPAPEAVKIET